MMIAANHISKLIFLLLLHRVNLVEATSSDYLKLGNFTIRTNYNPSEHLHLSEHGRLQRYVNSGWSRIYTYRGAVKKQAEYNADPTNMESFLHDRFTLVFRNIFLTDNQFAEVINYFSFTMIGYATSEQEPDLGCGFSVNDVTIRSTDNGELFVGIQPLLDTYENIDPSVVIISVENSSDKKMKYLKKCARRGDMYLLVIGGTINSGQVRSVLRFEYEYYFNYDQKWRFVKDRRKSTKTAVSRSRNHSLRQPKLSERSMRRRDRYYGSMDQDSNRNSTNTNLPEYSENCMHCSIL